MTLVQEPPPPTTLTPPRPQRSFGQILNMNFGFFGIQCSFGLQQSNMSPNYTYLGAHEASLPLLEPVRSRSLDSSERFRILAGTRVPPGRRVAPPRSR
jgi:hypothetical protein